VPGSCLTHVCEIQSALAEIPLDSLQVEVRAQIEPRAGQPGFESVPPPSRDKLRGHLQSPASQDHPPAVAIAGNA
jgi:hypothetical protein